MCKFKLFSIAAAALMMVACSTEDLTQQTQIKTGEMHFTATIAAPSGTTRTTYEQDGDNINVKWVVGDEIALVHNKVKDVAKVKSISSDGTSATIEGILTGTTDELNGAVVTLYYPAARISGVTSDGNPVFDGSVEGKISSQDGTPKYIQDNLDFRVGSSTFSVNGSEATLKEAAKMLSQIAIWKLTLSDGTNNLSATQVKIKGGESVLASTTTLTAGTSVVTLAIPTDVAIDGALTIEATVGDDTYAYTKAEGAKFNPGTYYQSTVSMAKAATDLSKLTADYTVKNGETLTGTLNGETQPYKITIADGATITLDGVTINGISSSDVKWAGITCLGDATIILKDGSKNTVKGFYEDYPGIQAGLVGKTLIIKGETKGTGSLDASPYDGGTEHSYGAGIGGGLDISCGDINIQGGVITVTGGYGAAGIGVGEGYGEENVSCATITISGGNVTATGGYGAAGIGGGYAYQYGVTCGAITISGGTVTAAGGDNAAGIGSGESNSGNTNTCGDITITADVTSVTATKGKNATNSIGAGNSGTCGTITIGGKVYADGVTISPYTYPEPTIGDVTPLDPFEGGGDPLAD